MLLSHHARQCANIGPADYNYDETISTLRYANRAKNIKNKARINEDPKDALLRQFQKEIEDLKKKLEEGRLLSRRDKSPSVLPSSKNFKIEYFPVSPSRRGDLRLGGQRLRGAGRRRRGRRRGGRRPQEKER